MFTFLLVFAPLLDMENRTPQLMSAHKTLTDCVIAATKATKEHEEQLRDASLREIGATFVCFELRGSV